MNPTSAQMVSLFMTLGKRARRAPPACTADRVSRTVNLVTTFPAIFLIEVRRTRRAVGFAPNRRY